MTPSRPPRINAAAVQQIAMAVGHAVWQLQMLEEVLVTHITLLHDLVPGCSRETLQTTLTRRRKLTFGELLRALDAVSRTAPTLPASLRTQLDALKKERNWLVHRSRQDAHVEAYTPRGAAQVLARIEALHAATTALMNGVWAVTEAELRVRGLDAQEMDARAGDIIRSWEKGERHPREIGNT